MSTVSIGSQPVGDQMSWSKMRTISALRVSSSAPAARTLRWMAGPRAGEVRLLLREHNLAAAIDGADAAGARPSASGATSSSTATYVWGGGHRSPTCATRSPTRRL